MAQFIEMIVRMTDDLDGSEAVETIEFRWAGKDLVIDLNDVNAKAFHEAMAPFLKAARSATMKPKTGKPPKRSLDRQARDEIREWGNANGFHVFAKSRIPAKVIEAYEQANGGNRNVKQRKG